MRRVNSTGVDQEQSLILLTILERVVGSKANRFSKFIFDLKNQKEINSIQPFETITQPQLQIAEITRGVCELFNALLKPERRPKTLIKVVLAEIKNKKVVNLPIFFPDDEQPRTSLQTLNQPESSIMTALRNKKIVIISSTKEESKKKTNRRQFAISNEDEDLDCSLICYPIRHHPTNSVPFLLSIHSDEPRTFTKKHSQLYEYMLARFECRISLEYSLQIIKKEVESRENRKDHAN